MSKPIVAVVGRPNVGKSTLVNRLAVSREAIVHESRGVTRDRSYHTTDWNGREFVLIDTGGIESVKSKDVFAPRIREQAIAAVEEADVIIFVVDGTTGVTDEDEEVARVLRKTEKPVFLCVNKLDNPVAIIGRPNVGKSSLANRLANKNRSIVSDVAGTTRDAVDSLIEWKGQRFRLVDTAGMRKKTQVHEDVEYYSLVRGLQAMDRADVALLVVDASVGVTEQDQKLVGMAVDRGCALVLLINKWDLVTTEEQRQDVADSIAARMTFAPWAPTINVSALTGRAVDKVLEAVVRVAANHAGQISTPKLNTLLTQIRESGHTVTSGRRRLKVNYGAQTGTKPPVFTFWCNAPDLIDDNYERFLENRLRENFELEGTPIRLKFRKKSED